MMQLLQGNCLELLADIPTSSVDFVLCDPPYGTTKCSWDIVIPLDQLWGHYNRILKPNGVVALFGQEPFSSLVRCSNLADFKYDLYWVKERITNIQQVKRRAGKNVEVISIFYKAQPTYNPQMTVHTGPKRSNKVKDGSLGTLTDTGNKKVIEYVDTGLRYPTQVLNFQRDTLTSNLHPTQKPVALLENLVRTFTNEGDLVLDHCMGSGSTGVACMNTNRSFIGMELDELFFKVASDRIGGLLF
jgi:DNA modification methylase